MQECETEHEKQLFCLSRGLGIYSCPICGDIVNDLNRHEHTKPYQLELFNGGKK